MPGLCVLDYTEGVTLTIQPGDEVRTIELVRISNRKIGIRAPASVEIVRNNAVKKEPQDATRIR